MSDRRARLLELYRPVIEQRWQLAEKLAAAAEWGLTPKKAEKLARDLTFNDCREIAEVLDIPITLRSDYPAGISCPPSDFMRLMFGHLSRHSWPALGDSLRRCEKNLASFSSTRQAVLDEVNKVIPLKVTEKGDR